MLKTQNTYVQYLNEIKRQIEECTNEGHHLLGGVREKFLQEITESRVRVSNAELLVPVVGAFSSGKSSLLNAFLEKPLLPVDITPETAIPTELHFAEQDRLEVFLVNGEVETHDISALAELSKNAENFKFVRLYLNNIALQSIEPLVLVDMPGYNSPLDAHNRAIAEYILRGAHYLFLVSVEEGVLHKQAFRHIDEIRAMGRSFSVCLNKADLRSASEIDELVSFINGQIEAEYGHSAPVVFIDQSHPKKFMDVVRAIEPDQLIVSLFFNSLKSQYFSIYGALNAAISSLKRSHTENIQEIEEMQQALHRLKQERDRHINELQDRSIEASAGHILNAISNRLFDAVDEMAAAQMRGGDGLGRILTDIVRSTMVIELQRAANNLSSDLVRTFAQTVLMDGQVAAVHVPDDWVNSLVLALKDQLLPALFAGSIGQVNKEAEAMAVVGNLASLSLAASKAVPHPVLKVTLAILPGIVGIVLDKYSESRKLDQIKEAISTQLIPDVTRQIRPHVATFLMEATKTAIEVVTAEFERKIETARTITVEAEHERRGAMEETAAYIEKLDMVRSAISKLADKTFCGDV